MHGTTRTYTLETFFTTRTTFLRKCACTRKLLSEWGTWVVGIGFHPGEFLRVGSILQRVLQDEEEESRLRCAHFAEQRVESDGLLAAVPFLEPGGYYLRSITESRRLHCWTIPHCSQIASL